MAGITTHVLDTSRGQPASGVDVTLEKLDTRDAGRIIGRAKTDVDGRVRSLVGEGSPVSGLYRLTFETRTYFGALGIDTFYPFVSIVFEVDPEQGHYHVPLLISPFGYTTYRGS